MEGLERCFQGFDAEVWFDIVVPVHILAYASEYERANTAAMNAYVRRIAERYLESLQAKLKNLGLTATMYAMLSSGGHSNSMERDRERVLDDVRNGYMSVIQAREVRRRRGSK